MGGRTNSLLSACCINSVAAFVVSYLISEGKVTDTDEVANERAFAQKELVRTKEKDAELTETKTKSQKSAQKSAS